VSQPASYAIGIMATQKNGRPEAPDNTHACGGCRQTVGVLRRYEPKPATCAFGNSRVAARCPRR
jgi:hypothetical protein